jgi:hypothetical protein
MLSAGGSSCGSDQRFRAGQWAEGAFAQSVGARPEVAYILRLRLASDISQDLERFQDSFVRHRCVRHVVHLHHRPGHHLFIK